MKHAKRKILAVLTTLCVLGTMSVPVFGAENTKTNDTSKLSNPRMTLAKPAVWDCVWFGHYPQSKVETSDAIYETLEAYADWGDKNEITINGDKYCRVEKYMYSEVNDQSYKTEGWEYYKCDPIKWRVLSVDGDEALLLADQGLDVKKFQDAPWDKKIGTWEKSQAREWLNGTSTEDFLGKAFDPKEQEAICKKAISNAGNPVWETTDGNDTEDKVFFLSIEEAINPSYGFPDTMLSTPNRDAERTAYAKYQEKKIKVDSSVVVRQGGWYLRSLWGSGYDYASVSAGGIYYGGGEYYVISPARPAVRINLEADSWFYAGTVSSDGTTNEKDVSLKDKTMPLKKMESPLVDTTTWDCVWFGQYPQTAKDENLFNNEPIKWRVLSVEGDEALLLADKDLDVKPYNETCADITWETSTVRKWLNGTSSEDFLGKAFDDDERVAILEKTLKTLDVEDPDFAEYKSEGGNDTQDNIFLLSIDEVLNQEYGFTNGIDWSETRYALNTDYTKSRDVYAYNDDFGRGGWWLRSPGYEGAYRDDGSYAALVGSEGDVDCGGTDVSNNSFLYQCTIRPALYLKLNSDVWSYAGTVCSDGTVNEVSSQILDHITATKTKTAYKTNETLNTNDLTVTACYNDGSSKAVTNYATNAAAIDMKNAGNKTLEVTYEENGVTKTATIQITVEKADVPPASEPTQQTTATSDNQKDPKPTKPADKPKKPKNVVLKKASSTKKGALKLTWKRDTKATGYQAVVATDKKFKKNKKTATVKKSKTVTKTFTKLKRKKIYYAKIRAYKQMGKTKVYGSYSKVKKAKIK